MKIRHKLIFLVPLIMVGCNRKYQSVVQKVSEGKILVKDVATGDEKIFITPGATNLQYLQPGDTLTYWTDPSSDIYKENKVIDLKYNERHLKCNRDSIYARKQREEFEKIKSEICR